MSSTTRPSLPLRTAIPKAAVSLVIAAGFVWAMRRGGLPIIPSAQHWRLIAWWAPALYALCTCAAIYLRTYRWLYLLRPIAPELVPARVFGIGLVGFVAIFFAPLRMGEVVRPWLLAEDRQVTFLQAAGTVAAERIIDGLTLTLFFVASLSLSTPLPVLPDHVGGWPVPIKVVSTTAYASCAVFAAALLLMALFYRFRLVARRVTGAVVGVASPRLASFLTTRLEKLADGFGFLPSLKNSWAFVRDTVLYWCVMLTATWALLRGCGLPASFAEAGVVVGVMGLGTLIPSGPGLFGTFQLAAYCGLAMFFDEAQVLGAGAVFAFASYTISIALTALSFPLGMLLMRRSGGDD